ncbi:hypothetical protein [Roseospira marina]|uniref:hypothetical protein n=1 Tax=Roseospira marina TaxID=140057 RepID=UPI001479532C|nr:hypothetical protein [Roseospira marina]MBB4315637.1 ABC-type polysaccharide/polyol phosphate export permease [Roseospira marina]MBB5088695.1 ABC-type polysaccharide/polyol phosphate export permease [Roseospira marina]
MPKAEPRQPVGPLRTRLRVARALARQRTLTLRRRALLGRFSAVVAPLWPLLVYLPLVAAGALPRPGAVPPLAYAALGYWTWSLLVDATLAPARGLAAHRGPTTAPTAAMLAGLIEAAQRAGWRAVILGPLALAATSSALPPLGILQALAAVTAALVLALAAGLILALWSAPWPDVPVGAATGLRLTLLPSLVLFPLPDAPWTDVATMLNPLALWTDTVRTLLLGDGWPYPVAAAAWSLLGLAGFTLALRALGRLAPCLREALG